MIPDLDSQIGITVYTTNFVGINGKIRSNPEDFVVSELLSERIQNSIKEQEGYAVFTLKKRKIDTNHALSHIHRKHGLRLKALGLKDASAITEQYVCSFNKGKSIDGIESERYSIKKIGYVKKPLSKKDAVTNCAGSMILRHRMEVIELYMTFPYGFHTAKGDMHCTEEMEENRDAFTKFATKIYRSDNWHDLLAPPYEAVMKIIEDPKKDYIPWEDIPEITRVINGRKKKKEKQ